MYTEKGNKKQAQTTTSTNPHSAICCVSTGNKKLKVIGSIRFCHKLRVSITVIIAPYLPEQEKIE